VERKGEEGREKERRGEEEEMTRLPMGGRNFPENRSISSEKRWIQALCRVRVLAKKKIDTETHRCQEKVSGAERRGGERGSEQPKQDRGQAEQSEAEGSGAGRRAAKARLRSIATAAGTPNKSLAARSCKMGRWSMRRSSDSDYRCRRRQTAKLPPQQKHS
jgi:hypothetical protein